jgi:hypothetical protein
MRRRQNGEPLDAARRRYDRESFSTRTDLTTMETDRVISDRIEDFEAGEHLVHRLGQVGFRHPRHSRDEKHVDDHVSTDGELATSRVSFANEASECRLKKSRLLVPFGGAGDALFVGVAFFFGDEKSRSAR